MYRAIIFFYPSKEQDYTSLAKAQMAKGPDGGHAAHTHSHTLTHVEGERLLTYTPAKHIDLTPNLRNSLTQRETDYLRTQFNL